MVKKKESKKRSYDEDSIQVHEGLKGVRKRPAMYIGTLGNPAVLQLIREVAENCVDEHTSGYNKFLMVKVEGRKPPQTFTIIDAGRGIPVGRHKNTGKSTLTSIMTKLHAGGKFDDESYGRKRGTHGVGVSVTNALSTQFEVWTCKDGNWYYQKFKSGEPVADVKKTKFPQKVGKGANRKQGTIVRSTPEYEIIGKKAKITDKELYDWLYDVAYLNSGLKVRLVTDKMDETIINKGGPKEYLKEIVGDKAQTVGKPYIFDTSNLTLVLQWTDYDGFDGIKSYVNGAYSSDGGCFLGETKVRLADGSVTTFEELEKSKTVKTGLTYNKKTGEVEEAELCYPRITKEVDELIEVELSDGSTEYCTPEHLWMLETGEWVKAEDLNEGDTLNSM